jgi:hypothetical protein
MDISLLGYYTREIYKRRGWSKEYRSPLADLLKDGQRGMWQEAARQSHSKLIKMNLVERHLRRANKGVA